MVSQCVWRVWYWWHSDNLFNDNEENFVLKMVSTMNRTTLLIRTWRQFEPLEDEKQWCSLAIICYKIGQYWYKGVCIFNTIPRVHYILKFQVTVLFLENISVQLWLQNINKCIELKLLEKDLISAISELKFWTTILISAISEVTTMKATKNRVTVYGLQSPPQ